MKKRLAKKLMKQSRIKINKIKPKEGEIIVFEHTRSIPVSSAKSIFDGIRKSLPNNKVIAIPKGCTSISLNTRNKIVEYLDSLVEKPDTETK